MFWSDVMKKGKFIIISGPSGVGKDTICDELVKRDIGKYSVSMTTRKKRPNEVDGISYFFVTKAEFEKYIKEDCFLEYAMYNGNYYGTPKKFIKDTTDNGDNVLAILEIKGAMNAKRIFNNAITIFIMPPSFEELQNRLRNRKSEDDNIINERLNIAKNEIKYKGKYDYVIINNTVDETVLEIENIINKN